MDIQKYDTPEKRQALYSAYCQHKREGFSDESFPQCDSETIKMLQEQCPEDFPQDEIRKAKREGRFEWEKIGKSGATGQPKFIKGEDGKPGKAFYQRFNAQAYALMMSNLFSWTSKSDVTSDGEPITIMFHESLKQHAGEV